MTISPKSTTPHAQGTDPNVRKDALAVLLMVVVSLAIGLGINALRDKPLPLVHASKAERIFEATEKLQSGEPLPGRVREIGLKEFQALRERGAVILDARPEVFHRLGHIPGAWSLPREDFESAYAVLRDDLEEYRAETVLVYCSSEDCDDSRLVAEGLVRLGFRDVAVLAGGWSAWQKHGLATEAAP